ncbi:hypothetical protein CEW89_06565 [Celeribacter ethanolicus]|uniref:DUF600 domain-containing protein n=1 Tax=Celeribacter ethanolicus TaxID=1758178 RepID=A0A291GAN9_9RHOB|nr:hypothetical protein [Celeribacter ethanolicus]ATG47261.1 hypothetical protein CEW89_06565 [Celeribacter ethanolicus]
MASINNLIQAIVDNEEEFANEWVSFSAIFGIDTKGRPESSNGYLYTHDDYIAIAPDFFAFEDDVAAYLKDIYGNDKLPIKMLVQFDRLSGRYKTEFEDKDDSRWRVRPADINGYIEELRPKFDQ